MGCVAPGGKIFSEIVISFYSSKAIMCNSGSVGGLSVEVVNIDGSY